jgi:hypothetical protein
MHPVTLADLPTAENAEGPAHNFFLSYPYLLIWTDQIDIWRFTDSSELTHIDTLSEYVEKTYSEPAPIIDYARGLVILPEPIRVGPPRLRVFSLHDGELVRDVELYGRLSDVPIKYRQADGHALVLLVTNSPEPHGQTSIVEVDVTGSRDDSGTVEALSHVIGGVELPVHLAEREKLRDIPPLVLEPVFFGEAGDIIATSTTRWLGTVDLFHWGTRPSMGDRQLVKTLELLPSQEECESMLPARHLSIDESTVILCTHEIPRGSTTGRTSIRAIDTSGLTVRWTAMPVSGNVKTLHYLPTLNLAVVSAEKEISDVDDESMQYRTSIVVLDVRTGEQRAIHAVDSLTQGSYVVDFFVSCDPENPTLCLVWTNGEVLTVSLDDLIKNGLEREGEGKRARALAVFPTEVIAAGVGRKEIMAVAGVKKHPVISEGGREEDVPDWEEEPGKVMLAKW